MGADEDESVYVGRSGSTRRALSHLFAATNSGLVEALKEGNEAGYWPRIFTVTLPVASWEDLHIFETTLIDLFQSDQRFNCVNRNGGDRLFRSRKLPDESLISGHHVRIYWRTDTEPDVDQLSATSNGTCWVTPPLAFHANAARLQEVISALSQELSPNDDRWSNFGTQFFGYQTTFGLDFDTASLPYVARSLSEIRTELGASFVLVSNDGTQFEEDDVVRTGIGVGASESSLRERARMYWSPGSPAHPTTPGTTLGSAESHPLAPKFVVQVVGRGSSEGKYNGMVLGCWPIKAGSWESTEPSKLAFPLSAPDPQNDHFEKCGSLVGSHLIDTINWQGKGAVWVM